MSCHAKFLSCDQCRNILEVIRSDNSAVYECCGRTMKELVANTSEGAAEKHIPVVEMEGNHVTVKVGSVYHPMTEEHSIDWVYLETEKGCQRVHFSKTEEPVAGFTLQDGDRAIAAYAFCNLHGFWKTEIH